MTGPRAVTGRSVLVTRPQEQAEVTAALLSDAGHRPLIQPLLDIEPCAVRFADSGAYQAVVLTSANAVRCLGETGVRLDLPAYVVGTATAAAAKAAGFGTVRIADGDGLSLAAMIRRALDPQAGRLLHPSGEHVATDLVAILGAEGFAVDRVIVYRAVPRTSLAAPAAEALADGSLNDVLFFSARTAETFTEIVNRRNLQAAVGTVRALCLSEQIAATAQRELSWKDVSVAALTDQAALLTALAE